jgi:hypothetical protein
VDRVPDVITGKEAHPEIGRPFVNARWRILASRPARRFGMPVPFIADKML